MVSPEKLKGVRVRVILLNISVRGLGKTVQY